MRTTFIKTLTQLAEKDKDIILLTADLGFSVFENFRDKFPGRFYNVGVQEQNMMGMAVGLALSGKKPYVYSIIPFLTMRCFEQIRNDIAYQKLNVRLVGVGSGFSYGALGATHHSIEDIALMRSLPNMTVVCPGDPIEVRELMKSSMQITGPVYFRLGKSGEPCIHQEYTSIELGRANVIYEGSDLTLIACGNMLEAARNVRDMLERDKISTRLISMHTLKPLDSQAILKSLYDTKRIFTLEEHNIIGGLGSAVAEVIAEAGIETKIIFKRFGAQDSYPAMAGSQRYIREQLGLSEALIYSKILKNLV